MYSEYAIKKAGNCLHKSPLEKKITISLIQSRYAPVTVQNWRLGIYLTDTHRYSMPIL